MQNPQLASRATLGKYHACGSIDGDGTNEDAVNISGIGMAWIIWGYATGTAGQEFVAGEITRFGQTMEAGGPTYDIFDG